MELDEEADDGEADEDQPDAEKETDLEMTLELSGKHLFITQSYIIMDIGIKDSKIG
jgi:hypothetical protein